MHLFQNKKTNVIVIEENKSVLAVGAGWDADMSSYPSVEDIALSESFKIAASQQWLKVIFKVDSAFVFRAITLGY